MNGRILLIVSALFAAPAFAQDYPPADLGEGPATRGTRVLPEQFLRGFDPITVYFDGNVGPGRGPADNGEKVLRIAPRWPGGWFWVDRQTLQFRPAEPWPALARFAIEARGTRRVLTTMMSAPSGMSPASESTDLAPFRSFTLTFPQTLPIEQLKSMLKLEIRELPGLADSPTRRVKGFTLSQLPRGSHHEAAVYAITLEEDVPEGHLLQINVSLALGDEGRVLWSGRLSTRMPFHLQAVRCGAAEFSLVGGASVPRDLALPCGSHGEQPQLVFSAPVQGDLGLSALKKLVRLEPAVPDLSFQTYGSRVQLRGRFVPDVLYRMALAEAPIRDESGRALEGPKPAEVFFYLGWRSPFLSWSQATALLEANGPRMVPLVGYGDARADVRIYRVDPLHTGLWPFPESPVLVDEEQAPPFPGEEPGLPPLGRGTSPSTLVQHLRLLGSPLVSRVVDLPLANKSGTTQFGLEVGKLLDGVVGRNRPGTYLIGLRRLTGAPQRAYMRVQVTNLSLTAVEERHRAMLFVRTLDTAEPVRGARILLEGQRWDGNQNVPATLELETDGSGRATLEPQRDWRGLHRISVKRGEDVLVIDPREPPPRFANNHWSPSHQWLQWIGDPTPAPVNDRLLGFLFTERPIYRPGETVFLKGLLRRKVSGALRAPGSEKDYGFQIEGPDGQTWSYPVKLTELGGFEAQFKEKDVPTGVYTARVFWKNPHQVLAERRFQIEAYRIPTFEVQLTGPSTVPLDRPFKQKAVARYYAGGSVVGQQIAWQVTRRPWHYVPEGREGFLFASSTQFARPSSSRGPEVLTGEGVLDASGSAEFSVNPALDLDGSARIYRFEATVTGADNQQVSAAQEVRALPPFVMGMKLPRYSEKAFTLSPEIIAVGVDGKLVKGQEISVRLYRRVWHSHLRETNFASGQPKYVTEQEDVKLEERTIQSGAEPVKPAFPLEEAGVYVVELFSRDRLGRVQTLTADLYVGGETPVAWQKSREGVFEVAPDKSAYAPGEAAKLVIQSPFQQGRALVVVEEPAGNRYDWVEVRGGKAVYALQVQPHHVPNLPVHVVLMRGRIGEAGEQDDSRYKPQTVASSLDLEITPVRNQVEVKVAHPEVARPGSKVDLVVTLADERGKPQSGEVTLWLVDEAVLSLAKEGPLDPLTAMIVRNARVSSVRDTRNSVLGRIAELEESPGGDGSEDEEQQPGTGKRIVRKNFQTVPFYQATLKVPASGRLVVPVQLSDDLTNFKVRAVAVSGFARFGYRQSTLRVRLPVIVQPQLPRFVRQGDQFHAGAIARLVEGPEGAANVEVKLEGPVTGDTLRASTELKRDVAMSFTRPFTVKTLPADQAAQLTVRADITRKSDGAGDAFEVKLPVYPDRQIERFAAFAELKPNKTVHTPLPEAARRGTLSQEYVFTTVQGLLEAASGIDYLARYPHGCLEQKMSQLHPEVALGGLLRRLELNANYSKQAAAHVRQLLEEMALNQTEEGLFAFWPGGPGDIQLTAQAVEFMHDARKAGHPVDEKLQTRAVEALQRVLRSDYPGLIAEYRWDQKVTALRALARTGHLDEHYLIELFHRRNQMDLTAIADLAWTMSQRPSKYQTNLAALETDLWNGVVIKLHRGKPTFEGLNLQRRGWSYGYLGSETATLAAVFEALLAVDPGDERLTVLRDALLSMAQAERGFGSTYDNRRALTALATYLEKARHPEVKATVSLNPLNRSVTLDKGHLVARIEERQAFEPSSISTTGPVGARISYAYLPSTPGDQVAALQQGFIVSRSATVIPADGSADRHLDDRKGQSLELASGDVVEVHAKLTSSEDRYHVALIVPFAAGFEPLNPALETSGAIARPSQPDSTTPSYVQRLDHEVRYYFVHLPKGQHNFHFRLRATTPGSYVHPSPWAEQMYHQEVRGRGDGMRVIVSASEARR